MGALLSCLGAQAGVCIGSAACNVICRPCGLTSSTATRAAYFILFLLGTSLAWLTLTDWAKHELAKVPRIAQDFMHAHCIETGACKLEDMLGAMGVMRVCFAMSMFFLMMSLTMVNVRSGKDCRRGLQNGFWAIKAGMILGLIIFAFFIPNQFFHTWSYLAMVGSFTFILIQLLLLVDFSFNWSEVWVTYYEESSSQAWFYALLGSTLGMLGLSVTMTTLMYVYFTGQHDHDDCSLSIFFITFNLLLCFVVCGLAVSRPVQEANERSGLLQAACVSLYSTYLVFTAVANLPHSECLPKGYHVDGHGPLQTVLSIVGALITFVSVGYASLSMSSAASASALGLGLGDGESLLETGGDPDDVDDDDEDCGVRYNWSFFHLTFALASLYIMMHLTNWGTLSASDPDSPGHALEIGHAMPAVWVKVVSSWMTLALYAWVLIAPLVLSDRDFS